MGHTTHCQARPLQDIRHALATRQKSHPRRQWMVIDRVVCEYGHLPDALTTLPFQIDHIMAEKRGGPTLLENLAYSCLHGNTCKGPNIAGVDQERRQSCGSFIRVKTHGKRILHGMTQGSLVVPRSAEVPLPCWRLMPLTGCRFGRLSSLRVYSPP